MEIRWRKNVKITVGIVPVEIKTDADKLDDFYSYHFLFRLNDQN